jgi:cell shape-determining protein MreC
MDWRNLSAILVFLLGLVVVWAAANGKFTTATPAGPDPEVEKLRAIAKKTVEELRRKEDMVFEAENVMNEQRGMTMDQSSKIKELLDIINQLSRKIDALEKENEALRKALKEALEALDRCRSQLNICKAQDAARRLEKQYCDMLPPSNLLR